jgi:hypothetical protein
MSVSIYKEEWKPFLDLFKQEVSDRSSDIDPSNSENWFSLTLGWAIAKGFDPVEAQLFATYVRYNTDLA